MEYEFKKGFRRHLKVTFPDGKTILHLNPPKLKLIKKMSKITNDTDMDELSEVMTTALSNNREKTLFTIDDIDELFTLDELIEFAGIYSNFIQEIKDEKN